MAAEAEARISGAIEKELDIVDKQCMRPLQVSEWVMQVFTNTGPQVGLYIFSLFYRYKHFFAVQNVARTKVVHSLWYKDAYKIV